VRANAARVLGVTEDKQSFDALLARATDDTDSRVRVSAIRALASVKDPRAAEAIAETRPAFRAKNVAGRPVELNEVLEIATTLGRLFAQKEDQAAIAWLRKLNEALNHTAPEVELAFVRIAPATYLAELRRRRPGKTKSSGDNSAQLARCIRVAAGLGEIAALPETVKNKAELAAAAQKLLRAMLDYRNSGST
jgi:hypothetical protein